MKADQSKHIFPHVSAEAGYAYQNELAEGLWRCQTAVPRGEFL